MSLIGERSTGAIPFLRDARSACPFYLLIHSARVPNPQARWEFPKGAIESGETPRQAAAREFMEETGLRRWRFHNSFQRSLTYTYTGNGVRRIKTVYSLAELMDSSATQRTVEHVEDSSGRWYRWSHFDEANRLLTHETMRTLLRDADSWLRLSPRFDSAQSSCPHRARPAGDILRDSYYNCARLQEIDQR